MTTDTDKIRDSFESEYFVENLNLRKTDGKYWDSVVQRMWHSYLSAYSRGQRDLINSMHVVGYRYYVDKMDYWELVEDPVAHRICYPVYFLPAGSPKLTLVPFPLLTSLFPSWRVRLKG